MQRRHHISAIITAVCGLRKPAAACTVLILVSATTSWIPCGRAAVDLSDTPMFNRIQPPPANIMFLMDDSGSMNFEILVRGEFDGSFPNPAKSDSALAADPHGFCYIFDDVGDNVYSQSDTPDWYAGPEGRKYWKSQWQFLNLIHFIY